MQTNQISSTLIQLNCEGLYEDRKTVPIFSKVAEGVLFECGARIPPDMDPVSVGYDIVDLKAQALEIEKAKKDDAYLQNISLLYLAVSVTLIAGGIIGAAVLGAMGNSIFILPIGGIGFGIFLLICAGIILRGRKVPDLENKLEETKKNIRFQPLIEAYTSFLKQNFIPLKKTIEAEIKIMEGNTPSLLPKKKEQDERLLTQLKQTLLELDQLYYHYANPAVRAL